LTPAAAPESSYDTKSMRDRLAVRKPAKRRKGFVSKSRPDCNTTSQPNIRVDASCARLHSSKSGSRLSGGIVSRVCLFAFRLNYPVLSSWVKKCQMSIKNLPMRAYFTSLRLNPPLNRTICFLYFLYIDKLSQNSELRGANNRNKLDPRAGIAHARDYGLRMVLVNSLTAYIHTF
jgi:hypothetical protein